ncbi:hypothetical protein ACED29_20660 [Shewanella sp. 5S214]|uniref:hypothetical protein n=1 Tax=Shewanella sp. 5S214 TaxID=3229999 RepID=UPI00352E37C5
MNQKILSPKLKNFLRQNIIWIVAAVVVILIYLSTGSSQSNKHWTELEKVSLCKAYIADQFGKPLDIMKLQRVGNQGLIYISYTRPQDNTEWDYVCQVDSSSMVWAGWVDGTWGRWRQEDKVSISYNLQTKTASFDSIMSSENIKVKL